MELIGFDPALEGLPGGADCELPKKSKPSKESAGFVFFGGAPGARKGKGGGRPIGASVVLGRAGGDRVSSLNRSTFCNDFLGGIAGWLDVEVVRCEEDRSNFAFSCTRLRGYNNTP